MNPAKYPNLIEEWGAMVIRRQQTFGTEQAANCLELALAAAPELGGPESHHWLNRLEAEESNLARAVDWFIEEQVPDDALRLTAALWRYWQAVGQLAVGREQIAKALDAAPETPSEQRAEALYGAGVLAFRQGDNHACRDLTGQSLAVARALGDDGATALALIGLCRAALRDENRTELESLAYESLGLSNAIGDDRLSGYALHMLAESAHMAGDLDRAEGFYADSLATSRRLNDSAMVETELYNLGQLARHKGDAQRASALLAESLSLAISTQDTLSMAYDLAALAATIVDSDPERAAAWLGAADGEFLSRGSVPDPADQRDFEATHASLMGRLGNDTFSSAYATGKDRPITVVAVEALAEYQSLVNGNESSGT